MSSWGTNPKALEKRQKQKQKKADDQQRREENMERAKWKDEETEKYMQKKKEKKMEANEELKKREQKKKLQEEEEREMEKYSKKGKTQTKKLTIAEIAARQMKHLNINVVDSSDEDKELEKPEIAPIGEVIEAHTVTQALQQLNQDERADKHPQKRMKASWNRFLEENLPRVKAENPNQKRSQHIMMLQEEWKKSPENPFNQKVAEYNSKV